MSGTSVLTKQGVADALSQALEPGRLQWVAACDGVVALKIAAEDGAAEAELRATAQRVSSALLSRASAANEQLAGLTIEFVNHAGDVVFTAKGDTSAPQTDGHRPIGGLKQPTGSLPDVKHIIAIGASKGGVGKSTVSVNLAVGLARKGHAVGLLDGDIYGPSLPTMLGLDALEQIVHEGRLQPHLVHGVKAITLGKLVDPDKPLIWRGPMAHGAFKQLAEQTAWGELDYLVIDLPPGTGDVPLTMAQTLSLTGAVIVCTPQRVAQDDAVRAARMFQQLGIDVLGVVENMSYFVGDDGKTYDIFGRGGAEHMAQRLGLPFLGALPITMSLRANSDTGNPTANFEPSHEPEQRLKDALESLIGNLEKQVALAGLAQGRHKPTLTIS